MSIFVDIHQYHRIGQVSGEASSARNKAERAEEKMATLERRVDRLALACQALWELIREKTDLSDSDVSAKMQEIDLRDGYSDGKIGGRAMQCPACGKTINSSRPVCIYCGRANDSGEIVR